MAVSSWLRRTAKFVMTGYRRNRIRSTQGAERSATVASPPPGPEYLFSIANSSVMIETAQGGNAIQKRSRGTKPEAPMHSRGVVANPSKPKLTLTDIAERKRLTSLGRFTSYTDGAFVAIM